MNRVRFAVVTDIHYGPDVRGKLGTTALSCVQDFRKAACDFNADFIARLGDDITSQGPKRDLHDTQTIEQEFAKACTPVHFLDGNHDGRHIGQRNLSYYKDYNGHRFIFWNPNVRLPSPIGLFLPDKDIKWLKSVLDKTSTPTIVFSHIPLDNEPDDNRRDLHFNRHVGMSSYYPQGPQVRKIMEDSGKVILCMAGHRHVDQIKTINGIHYITQQALTEDVREIDETKPYNAQGFLEINSDNIKYERRGEIPYSANFQRRAPI